MKAEAERPDHREFTPEREEPSTLLHEERMDAVIEVLRDSGAATVLDLGCGSGTLLRRLLVEKQFIRVVGLDSSLEALARADRLCASVEDAGAERFSLRYGSFTTSDEDLSGFDAAVMVETIEHVEPAHLSRVERAVFDAMRPGLVVMTTPNREYNALYGMEEGELRRADHRFEWGRAKFESWASGVGERNGYRVEFEGVGPANVWLGAPTQMAIFRWDAA